MDEPTEAGSAESLPSLPIRLVQLLISPGRLMEALARNPRWAAAAVLGAVLSLVGTALIPADIWTEMFRQQMLQSGQAPPEGLDFGAIQRGAALVGVVVFWFIFIFLYSGISAFVFAFVLGDDGKYRQYLAVTAHAFLVPALAAVLLVPLRIAQRNIQFGLNLGVFAPFLDSGYLLNYLTAIDLFQIWSLVLLALGAHAIDRRRGWGSAILALMVFQLGITALLALLIPT